MMDTWKVVTRMVLTAIIFALQIRDGLAVSSINESVSSFPAWNSPNLIKNDKVANLIKEHRVASQQQPQLRIPQAIQEYFHDRMNGQRQGRQIVPGVYSCGHQGSDVFTNLINPHYPAHDRVAGTCQFRMLIENPKICQVRVDFVDTEMLSPTEGECQDQYLIVSGALWNTGFHRLCGINPDQHFYLHLKRDSEFKHLDFTVTSVSSGIPYKFGLWITQIDCEESSSVMAPLGCTQYYLGAQGNIKSFNFEGVQYLNNQNYKICIKSEKGACYGEFRADVNQFMLEPIKQRNVIDNRSSSNSRTRNKELSEQQLSGCGDELCARDYLLIPGGTGVLPGTEASVQSKDKKKLESRDRFCGGSLNVESGEHEGTSIYTRVSSGLFSVQFVTGEPSDNKNENILHGPGFRLRYVQINCAAVVGSNDRRS